MGHRASRPGTGCGAASWQLSGATLCRQDYAGALPLGVSAPGAPVGRITASAAAETGLPDDCVICSGTTGACLFAATRPIALRSFE